MVSLLEKMMLAHVFPHFLIGIPGDVTFATSICFAYFLWDELELPPSAKHPTMVFILEHGVL